MTTRRTLCSAFVAGVGLTAAGLGAGRPERPAAVAADAAALTTAATPDRTTWLRARLEAATPGATIEVPPGTYRGPFTLNRPVRLVSDGRAHLLGDGTSHTVAIRAADVTIDGFEISGSGLDLDQDHAAVHVTGARATITRNRIHSSLHGVYVRQADGARITGNVIAGAQRIVRPLDPFTSGAKPADSELCEVDLDQNRRGNGIHAWNSGAHLIAGNTIRHTRDGIYFSFVERATVQGNDVAGVRYGLHYMYSDANVFEDNVFRDNAAGAAIMSSRRVVLRRNQFLANQSYRSYGVLLQTVDDTTLEANRIAGNTVGVFFESGHGNRLIDNTIAGNHVGIHASDSSDGNQFAGNRFDGNLHTIETTGGNLTSTWTIDGRGNYWDGAVRLDLDRNGLADLPHRELDLFGPMRRQLPAIGLLAGSPGERLLRFVHARIALPGLPGVTDTAPLVRPGQP